MLDIKNEKGSAVLAVLISAVVGAILTVGIMQVMKINRDSAQRLRITSSASVINSSLVSLLTNTQATLNILNDPSNAGAIACTANPFDGTGGSCLSGAKLGPLKIANFFSSAIDPTQPTYGFTFGGQFCNAFDIVKGNDACPLRFEVYAVITCPPIPNGTACSRSNYHMNFQVQVYGRSSTVHFDPNFAVLDRGNELSFKNPATMKCYMLSNISAPGPSESTAFDDSIDCIFSGNCPTPAPTPMATIPPQYGSIVSWAAPQMIGGQPMWGVSCAAPYVAGSCDSITSGGSGQQVIGLKNINNGCYTNVLQQPIVVNAYCCQLQPSQ